MQDYDSRLSRRDFFRKTAAATVGVTTLGLSSPKVAAQDKPLMPKRLLKPTDLEVSVIGFGTEFIQGEEVIEYCIEQGVTYIDTAANYQEGNAERQLKPILARHRGKLVVGTKVRGERDKNFTKQDFLDEFHRCLERMGIDKVDIFFLHDRRSALEVTNYAVAHEAFQELHAAGQARWFGMSTHLKQVECVNKAVELGWFHVLEVAYHFMSTPEEKEALERAHEAGIGILNMKSVKGLSAGKDWFPRATEAQMERIKAVEAPNLFQAAIRWNLMHDFCSCVVLCMMSYDEAKMDLPAAFGKITAAELEALKQYAQAMSHRICRACGTCETVCPERVAVATILRYLDYFEGYGQVHRAMASYRGLPRENTFAACTKCGVCEAACPHGIAITERLAHAHRLMA